MDEAVGAAPSGLAAIKTRREEKEKLRRGTSIAMPLLAAGWPQAPAGCWPSACSYCMPGGGEGRSPDPLPSPDALRLHTQRALCLPRPKSPLAFPKRAPSPSRRKATPIFGLSTAAAGSAEMMYSRRHAPHQKLRTTKYEGLDQHPSEHCEKNLILDQNFTRIVTNLN